jgi:hypothetical protein
MLALALCVLVGALTAGLCQHAVPNSAPAAAGQAEATTGTGTGADPAAALPGTGGPLGHLAGLRPGRSARVSSAAPTRGSNADNRRIPPGGKLVLADIAGPGTIQHIWLTFPEPAPGWLGREGNADHSELVLRMYWDGAARPAVESPVGDFFAAGFGQRAEINSAAVAVRAGNAYNCYWPMPFHKSARIEIENQSAKPLNSLYYHIDYLREDSLPPQTPYFCAQYRQEFPTQSGRDYLILEAEGRGHYVGTVLSVRSRSPEWFGEGDEKFYIDGEKRPSIWGTGTEDYVSNAWGMGLGTFPYFGVMILDEDALMVGWRTTAYRWHVPDPIRFTRSLRVEIENTGWISTDELKEGANRGHVERNDDYATVAFWYQTGQPKSFATVPPAAERRLANLDLVTEGKDLLKAAKMGKAEASLQKGYAWTGEGQVFFNNVQGKGDWIEVEFPVAKEELRQLTLRMTYSYDFGIYRILLDGQEVRDRVDFFSPQVAVRELNLGSRRLPPGRHTLRFECLGQRTDSTGARLGIDSVRLRQRWDVKREGPKEL